MPPLLFRFRPEHREVQVLLDRIQRRNYGVFTRRVRLTAAEKSWILVRALVD